MGKNSAKKSPAGQKRPLWLVGIDEAGRGPIAGPVAVGLIAIPNGDRDLTKKLLNLLGGKIKDSKQLTAKKREIIYQELLKLNQVKVIKMVCALVSNRVIDEKGIASAIRLGIKTNLQKLKQRPEETQILLDGSLKAPVEYINQQTIIRGDASELVIALASIVAKVKRDQFMAQKHLDCPQYGFDQHKGYGTKLHYQKIKEFGLSDLHRQSFLKNV